MSVLFLQITYLIKESSSGFWLLLLHHLLLLSPPVLHLSCLATLAFQFLMAWTASWLRNFILSVPSSWGTLLCPSSVSSQPKCQHCRYPPNQYYSTVRIYCLPNTLFYSSRYFSWFEVVVFVNLITIYSPSRMWALQSPEPSPALFTPVSRVTKRCLAHRYLIRYFWKKVIDSR